MASCSIVLPALFLIFGILIAVMNWKPSTSSWPTVTRIIDVAAAIWPVAFAAVVTQCFKAYIIRTAGRRTPDHEQTRRLGQGTPPFRRLQVMCILVFLIWSLSPFGSQALEHVYGTAATTQQVSTSAWYLDQTGYNRMWSANSTSTMSSTSRSQLLQAVSESYIASLTPVAVLPDGSGQSTSYSLPLSILTGLAGSSFPDTSRIATNSQLLLSSWDIGSTPILDNAAGISQTLSFSMLVSDFDLTCGNWSTMLRNMTNTGSDRLSYSSGQTLGLTMRTDDTSHITPAGSVEFVSLNNISSLDGFASSADKDKNEASLWEYSAIQCDYQQYFYSVPVQCSRSYTTSGGICVQSDKEGPMLTLVGLSRTELGDFSHDFVSANLPTAGNSSTISEFCGPLA